MTNKSLIETHFDKLWEQYRSRPADTLYRKGYLACLISQARDLNLPVPNEIVFMSQPVIEHEWN